MNTNTPRPLDAEYVGLANRAAMRALGDVKARSKWPDSKWGSPVAVNAMCAEIARLNIAQTALIDALKIARDCIAYCRKNHPDAQSGEGIPVEAFIEATLAKATLSNPEQEGNA